MGVNGVGVPDLFQIFGTSLMLENVGLSGSVLFVYDDWICINCNADRITGCNGSLFFHSASLRDT